MNSSTDEDTQVMQNGLDKIYDWADLNDMVFNDQKFEHLEYASHLPYGVQRLFPTKEGNAIEKSEVVNDLGVYMYKDGTFIRQVQDDL